MMPPKSHADKKVNPSPVLEATKDGALKTKTPTTMPTMMATASVTESVGFGSATLLSTISPPMPKVYRYFRRIGNRCSCPFAFEFRLSNFAKPKTAFTLLLSSSPLPSSDTPSTPVRHRLSMKQHQRRLWRGRVLPARL